MSIDQQPVGHLETSEHSLNAMTSGQKASVTSVAAGRQGRRLTEIGFVPGALVEMLRCGDPCIVRLYCSKLSMDRSLQRDVLVSRQ
jgi:Fe2+ transport system protein FeoA